MLAEDLSAIRFCKTGGLSLTDEAGAGVGFVFPFAANQLRFCTFEVVTYSKQRQCAVRWYLPLQGNPGS